MPLRPHLQFAALAFVALAGPLTAAESGKPNILVILADDLGWGELGVQGFAKDIPTPNIDSIASNGVRFTSGYVSGPYCSPTRAGLLTGKYQQRLGHEFNPGPAAAAAEKVGLDLTQKTAGDRLKAAGYATAWIGKSHLGYDPEFHPNKRGFDHYFGFLGGAHTYLAGGGEGRDPVQRNGQPVEKIEYLTEELGREAAGFMEKNKAQPWFTYLAFNAMHGPLEATEKYLARFPNITDPKRQKFAGLLSALDDAVGVVFAKLRETGQEENTLIFFLSDNGGPTAQTTSGNGLLRGFKAQTWEGGVRVPWFVQWKGKIPAGKVDERPVIQIDILPTSLAAAGVTPEADAKFDGVNLLPYLTEIRNRHYGLAQYYDQIGARADGNYRTLLEEVSKSPVVAKWLSHLQNQKAIADGRDHNITGYSMFLTGAGVKRGYTQRRDRRIRDQGRRWPHAHQRPARDAPRADGSRPRSADLPLRRPRLPPHGRCWRCLAGGFCVTRADLAAGHSVDGLIPPV